MKNLKKLGEVLSSTRLKAINGGSRPDGAPCPAGYCENLDGGCTYLVSAIFDDCA